MAFYVEDTGSSFERCPAGLHLARCYRIIDLGTQKTEYMGQPKLQHKITFFWEIHGTNEDGTPLRLNDGRPFSIFKNYTLSWSEKANLRLDLQSWRGKPFTQEELRRFDLENVLDAWCMLNIIERPAKTGNKIYSNVETITPVPSQLRFKTVIENGEEKRINILPPPVNKKEIFSLKEPDFAMFETFSDNLKAKIEASPEWQRIAGKAMGQAQSSPAGEPGGFGDGTDDDIPF